MSPFYPGHGKDGDPGAVGASGLKESEVTATLAAYLDNELRLAGLVAYQVDRSLLSSQRAEEAAANGCDLLVSLHCTPQDPLPRTLRLGSPTAMKRERS
ncbi:MAG: N-acetylmuramoyl-L-alanine amidase [Coprothermobacterota bacterium]|nr:N-acetylmuramoyl-L-alanine amidase [Coprothermobacterota bacterium]